MTFGLRIYDDNGYLVLDENTYTVRMVKALTVNYGKLSAGERRQMNLSGVNKGMFAIVTPLWQYQPVYKTYPKWYQQWNGSRYSMEAHDTTPCLPSVEVYDGYIEVVASSIPYSTTDTHVAVHIFTNR